MKGIEFTLIDLLKVGSLLTLGGVVLMAVNPFYVRGCGRSKVSRVKSDMRSLATGLETYYVDNNEYPAMANRAFEVIDGNYYAKGRTQVGRTFRARNNTESLSLTTPIAYITSIFADPFADSKGTTFRYYSTGDGWILGSWGPDRDERTGGQLEWDKGDLEIGTAISRAFSDTLLFDTIETVYDPAIDQPSLTLIAGASVNGAFTYDPTNGSISPGDIWRVKQ